MSKNWTDVSAMTEEEFRTDRKKAGWGQAQIDATATALKDKFSKSTQQKEKK